MRAVQRRRELPIRILHGLQSLAHRRIVAPAVDHRASAAEGPLRSGEALLPRRPGPPDARRARCGAPREEGYEVTGPSCTLELLSSSGFETTKQSKQRFRALLAREASGVQVALGLVEEGTLREDPFSSFPSEASPPSSV